MCMKTIASRSRTAVAYNATWACVSIIWLIYLSKFKITYFRIPYQMYMMWSVAKFEHSFACRCHRSFFGEIIFRLLCRSIILRSLKDSTVFSTELNHFIITWIVIRLFRHFLSMTDYHFIKKKFNLRVKYFAWSHVMTGLLLVLGLLK